MSMNNALMLEIGWDNTRILYYPNVDDSDHLTVVAVLDTQKANIRMLGERWALEQLNVPQHEYTLVRVNWTPAVPEQEMCLLCGRPFEE